MTDDDLLRKLGALERERAREEPEVERLDDLARERIVAHLAANVAPRRRLLRATRIAGGLVIAAGIAIVATRLATPEPLPEYALLSSDQSETRGPAGDRLELPCRIAAGEGSFELVASSENRVSGDVVARAFLVRGADLEEWKGALEVSPQGSVRITGSSRALAGASELRVVVARSGRDAETKARSLGSSGATARVLRCKIE